ncbi:hypothetical protein ACA910_011991 [Epithemia clementina (nom. ined.)]
MIAQGTDGLLQGDLMNEALAGVDMLQYVPLNRTAEERQPGLAKLFIGTASDSYMFLELNQNGWFKEAFRPGYYLWIPPPAAADVALEKLSESKQIRAETEHIFICPALMMCHWRKKLRRVADLVFFMPMGCKYWQKE